MLGIREMEPTQRPRERLLEIGAAALSDAELVAILLRTGRPGRSATTEAHQLLAEAGGVGGLATRDARDLADRPGIGPAKACALAAAFELARRLATVAVRTEERLDEPRAAGEFVAGRVGWETSEVFGFVSLDGRHRFVAEHLLTRGTRNQAPVDVADLMRIALRDRAAAVIVFHNHPSGDLQPSADDLELTRRLVRAGAIVGVPVLDHLIVAGGRWLSLRVVRPGVFSEA